MRQDVTCLRCKYVSTTFQHFMDILVDIRQASNIEEALQHFFRQEKLGNAQDENSMYKCEKCKVKVPAKKRCFLEKPPAVLCIQLKRFSLMGGKIGKPVQLSRSLNIAPFIYPRNGAHLEQVQYKLVSMITHVGPTPNCGHYTAIGEANGQFYQFDDASVRPIPLSQVLNTASYVVFYEMTRSSWANVVANNSENGTSRPVTATATSSSATSSSSNGERFIGPQKPPSFNRITAEATSLIKPRIIGANGIVNKLGVVSSAAKSVANVVADAAKTVVSSTQTLSNKSNDESRGASTTSDKSFSSKGLVPYDAESSEDEASSEPTVAKKQVQQNASSSSSLSLTKPQFVPRALTVKKLNEKSSSPPTCSSPVQATKKNWHVTDVDHHNPSVHSDNSTGSTNGGWIVTNQVRSRPSSAMSDDSKPENNKWTVTPLQRAIEESSTSSISNSQNANLTSGPSTPTSSTSTSSSTISNASEKKRKFSSDDRLSRKRPSIDENVENDDYDAELDRGRTKKVKRIEPPSNRYRNGDSNGERTGNAGGNPFQAHQDRANSMRSMSSPSYRNHNRSNNHWNNAADHRSRDYYHHSSSSSSRGDHDYQKGYNRHNNHGHHRDSFRGRRQSYSGSDNRDKSRQHHHKGFNRSFSYGHRDNYRNHNNHNRDSYGRRPSFKSSAL